MWKPVLLNNQRSTFKNKNSNLSHKKRNIFSDLLWFENSFGDILGKQELNFQAYNIFQASIHINQLYILKCEQELFLSAQTE